MQEQHESNQLRLILLLTTDRKCNLLVKSCMHQMLNANKNCMGEQGAESIHAKLKLKLKSIMKEHYLNVPPHMDQLQYRGQ